MTDKPNLADARRVTEAATEGPWYREYGDVILSIPDPQSVAEGYEEDPQNARVFRRARHLPQHSAQAIADANFAVASRTLVPALLAAVDAVLAECDGEIDMHSRHRELTSLDPDHRPCESASRARFAQRIRGAITAHLDIEEQR